MYKLEDTKEKRKIVALVGLTGTGKSTIYELLKKDYGLKPVREVTSRPRRQGESNEQYTFLSPRAFHELERIGEIFLANHYKVASGDIYSYGFLREDLRVENQLSIVQANYKTVEGLRSIYGEDLVVIKLTRPAEDILESLKLRGDNEEEILRRCEKDKREYGFLKVDHEILNEDPRTTAHKIFLTVEGVSLND